jgi:hypothetical protein
MHATVPFDGAHSNAAAEINRSGVEAFLERGDGLRICSEKQQTKSGRDAVARCA